MQVLLGSDEIDDLDFGREPPVGQRHPELELEIGEYAQTTHDRVCTYLTCIVYSQNVI